MDTQAHTQQDNPQKSEGGCSFGCAKAFAICFFLFLCLFGGFVALLMYGSSSGNAKIKEYFERAEEYSNTKLAESFHPSIAKEGDPLRLAMLIKAVPAHYGQFKDVEMNGFSFSDKVNNGVRLRDYKGNFVFEKGTIPMEMSFIDEKLIKFQVASNEAASPLLPYLKIPEDLSSYQKKAKEFWEVFLSGDGEKAFSLMSEPLQKEIGRAATIAQVKNLQTNGALKGITFLRSIRDEDKQKVHFLFQCSMEKGSAVGHVSFEFHLLQSFLIGYQIPSPFAAQLEEQ